MDHGVSDVATGNPSSTATDDNGDPEDIGTEETVDALLSEIEDYKRRGNVEYNRGSFLAKHTAGKNILSDACILYAEGVEALSRVDACLARLKSESLSSDFSTSDETEQRPTLAALFVRADAVRPSLYLNLAACNLLLHEWDAAIACCTHVLEKCGGAIIAAVAYSAEGGGRAGRTPSVHEIDGETSKSRAIAAKAFYRRSTALVGCGDFLRAREDLVRALRLKPEDVSIRRGFDRVDKRLADDDARESFRRETEQGRKRHQCRERQLNQRQHRSASENETRDSDAASAAAAAAVAAGEADDEGENGEEEEEKEEEEEDACFEGAGKRPAGRRRVAAPRGAADKAMADTDGAAGNTPASKAEREAGEAPALDHKREQWKNEGGEENGDVFPTLNGGEGRDGLYAWNQSVNEVHVCVKVPEWTRASDLRVSIHRSRLSVTVSSANSRKEKSSSGKMSRGIAGATAAAASHQEEGEEEEKEVVVLVGDLSRPVQVDECLWTLESPGRVLLYLQKELPGDGEPGYEWWESVMEGDPKVDVSKCDAGSDVSKYPEHARRRGAKALWEHQRKSPEDRRKEELNEQKMRDAREQMEVEAEERQRNLDHALKDPKKAELYRQLRKAMPDTPISMK